MRWGGGLIETGSLFNLESTIVSILHKGLVCKVEKLKVIQPRIRIKFKLPVGNVNHPGSVYTVLQSWLINTVYHLLVKSK